jgi:hypothetical protein
MEASSKTMLNRVSLPSMTATLVTRKRCTELHDELKAAAPSTGGRSQKTSLAARAAKLGICDFSLNSTRCSRRAAARRLSRATAAALAAVAVMTEQAGEQAVPMTAATG